MTAKPHKSPVIYLDSKPSHYQDVSVFHKNNISLKAKGLFAIFFMDKELGNGFLSQKELAKICGCGTGTIRSAISELVNVGYITRKCFYDPITGEPTWKTIINEDVIDKFLSE